jgi:cellulose synthase/poly-beta-1,6-N-acetylglucosamine synthase-like glycosyltransferase
VAICTRDRPRELERCLRAVARLEYPSHHVIVVDNAPTTSDAREIAAAVGAVYLQEVEPGLSRARNRAARESTAEVIAFLDDDSVPAPDWLTMLIREFDDPTVMAVVGRILPLQVETHEQQVLDCVGDVGYSGAKRSVFDRGDPNWLRATNLARIGTGGNMAFRRKVFNLWAGFDTRLGRGAPLTGGEEHLAFFSLIDRGYRVVGTPDAIVHHPSPPTLAALRQRQLEDLATATAFWALLLAEGTGHRWELLRYFADWTARPDRAAAHRRSCLSIAWYRAGWARLSGVLRYLRMRLSGRAARGVPAS